MNEVILNYRLDPESGHVWECENKLFSSWMPITFEKDGPEVLNMKKEFAESVLKENQMILIFKD